MAEPLKNYLGPRVVRRIAAMIAAAHERFPERRFIAEACAGLDDRALLERGRHIAAAMRRALPDDYEEAARVLVASLGPELDRTEGFGMDVFCYLPHVAFVGEYGVEHFEASMQAQYEITKRFSAEFSIRVFLQRYPGETLSRLAAWARDPNPHVRRLASEGTRPRLPWAPRLPAFQADPHPVLALLELLKDDPVLLVRRSVANNLNDVGKDHPDVLIDVARRWLVGASPERTWLIQHALRWLVKRGDRAAIALLGYGDKAELQIEADFHPKRVRLGGQVRVALAVRNGSRRAQRAIVDLAVHFVKAGGASRPKVFKVRAVDLAPGASAELTKVISFAQMTTRTHRAGRHRLEVIVNGEATPIGHVEVLESR